MPGDFRAGPIPQPFCPDVDQTSPILHFLHPRGRKPPADQKSAWLSEDADVRDLLSLLGPVDETAIRAYEVSPLVNRASVDTPEVMQPVSDAVIG